MPGASRTFAYGINNTGQIVGSADDDGFLDSGGDFTQIDVPGMPISYSYGINDSGQIVGGYYNISSNHGFFYEAGNFTTIDAAEYTSLYDINNSGQIVGGYGGFTGNYAFLYSGGSVTTIIVPGAINNYPIAVTGINDAGQIVGYFSDNTGTHGFLDTNDNLAVIDVPGARFTYAQGINNTGQIVGYFYNGTGNVHGFLYSGGEFTQIDVPGATFTEAYGINDAGQIVGEAYVSGGTGDPHFTTYSGVTYNFQGVGDFLLARSNVAGDEFEAQIRTAALSNGTSVIEGIAATLGNHDITFDVDRAAAGSGFVWLDGSPISLSVGVLGLALGACEISEPSSAQYELAWDTGERLDITDYGTWLAVSSQLSSMNAPGSIEGLLASDVNPDAWRVSEGSLFDPAPVMPTPGPAASDPLLTGDDGSLDVMQVVNGAAEYTQLGGLGPEWEFAGRGDLLADCRDASFLLRNNGSVIPGALYVGEDVGGNAAFTPIGGVGAEWQFEGVGNFLGDGHSGFLMRNAGPVIPGMLEVGEVVDGQAVYTPMGGVGPEWQFGGIGDFLGDGRTGFAIRNTGSVLRGVIDIGEVVNGTAVYTTVGGAGAEWQFAGTGDFLGDGHTGLLLRNTGMVIPGVLAIGEVVGGELRFTEVGAIGSEWEVVGSGSYLDGGRSDFLIRNTGPAIPGALYVGRISGDAAYYTAIGAADLHHQFHAASP